MTTPAAYPSQYQGDYTDYLKAPCDRSGAVRLISDTVTIADATSAGTILGLVPFRKGARLGYGSALYVGDLDTTITLLQISTTQMLLWTVLQRVKQEA